MLKKINFKLSYLLLLILSLLIHFKWMLNSDEGVLLAGAWALYNGKEMFIDFFTYISPASFFFIFFIWKIFWPSYLVINFFSIILFSLSAFGILKISKIFISDRYLFYLPSLLFVIFSYNWPLINHNVYSLFFVIWSMYFFLRFLDSSKRKFLLGSGVMAGLSFLFLQHRGVLFISGYFFYFIIVSYISGKHTSFKQKIVFFASTLTTISLLFFVWTPVTIFNNLFLFPYVNYTGVNKVSFL